MTTMPPCMTFTSKGARAPSRAWQGPSCLVFPVSLPYFVQRRCCVFNFRLSCFMIARLHTSLSPNVPALLPVSIASPAFKRKPSQFFSVSQPLELSSKPHAARSLTPPPYPSPSVVYIHSSLSLPSSNSREVHCWIRLRTSSQAKPQSKHRE